MRSVPVVVLSLLFIALFSPRVSAQKDKKENTPPGPLLTRTVNRRETVRLLPGGTLTISGAPLGSIVIEGWDRSEVEIDATIEWQGPTAADLDLLAVVNNFAIDD